MPSIAHYKLEGVGSIEKTLRELSSRVGRNAVYFALKKAGAVLEAEMKLRLDAVTKGGTGATRDSIKVAISAESGKAGTNTGMVDVGPTKDRSYIGRFMEFGTSRQPARPWATVAWDAKKQECLQVLLTELQKSLARALKRQARAAEKAAAGVAS